jgi:hypothetical protein
VAVVVAVAVAVATEEVVVATRAELIAACRALECTSLGT